MAANRILLLALIVLVILDIFLNNYERSNTECSNNQSGGRQDFVKALNNFADKPPVASAVKPFYTQNEFELFISKLF